MPVWDVKKTVKEFKKSLTITQEKAREIKCITCDQHNSTAWFDARQYRLTASNFGAVYRRKPSTSPDQLVLRLLSNKCFVSAATDWYFEWTSCNWCICEVHKVQRSWCSCSFYSSITWWSSFWSYFYWSTSWIFLEIKCPYSVGEKHRKMLAHQVDLLVPRRNAIKKLYYVFIGITYTTHKYGNRRKAVAWFCHVHY